MYIYINKYLWLYIFLSIIPIYICSVYIVRSFDRPSEHHYTWLSIWNDVVWNLCLVMSIYRTMQTIYRLSLAFQTFPVVDTKPMSRRSLTSAGTRFVLHREGLVLGAVMESVDLDALMYRLGVLGCPKVRAREHTYTYIYIHHGACIFVFILCWFLAFACWSVHIWTQAPVYTSLCFIYICMLFTHS
jgi:hypothetical protein